MQDEPHAAERTAYAIILAYNGRPYFGWQRLKDSETVQGCVESAIEVAFGSSVKVRGAGRTDRGAHAEGQVAGFLLPRDVPASELVERLNDALPAEVRVVAGGPVPMSFHPREDAIAKTYAYRIDMRDPKVEENEGLAWQLPEMFDVGSMQLALQKLVGEHDFASFGTKTRHAKRSTVRTIFDAELQVEDHELWFVFRGNSFLNHMVRNMVRLLVNVGLGERTVADVEKVLAAADRKRAGGTAPSSGLYLMSVEYPDPIVKLLSESFAVAGQVDRAEAQLVDSDASSTEPSSS